MGEGSVLTPLATNCVHRDRPILIRWSSSVESTKDFYTRKEWIDKNRRKKQRKKQRKGIVLPSKKERALLAKKWIIGKSFEDLSRLCYESHSFRVFLNAALACMPIHRQDTVWCSIETWLVKMELREFNHCHMEALRALPEEHAPPGIDVFASLYALLQSAEELRDETAHLEESSNNCSTEHSANDIRRESLEQNVDPEESSCTFIDPFVFCRQSDAENTVAIPANQ